MCIVALNINVLAQNKPNIDKYSLLIQQGDKSLLAKDYANALQSFDEAQRSKPGDKVSVGKIKAISALLDSNSTLRAELFETQIIDAEANFKQKKYPEARISFQKAILLDPTARYPKDRLAEISRLYTDPSDNEYYTSSIHNGDNALAEEDFEKAIAFYENALSVKPDAIQVREKITNARKSREESDKRRNQATTLVASADKMLQNGKRTEALDTYRKALELTPKDEVVKSKIAEIEQFFKNKEDIQKAYDQAIEQGDQFYMNRDFASARQKYNDALKAKPEARYPKEMLAKSQTGESQQANDQQKYDAAIANADNLLKNNDLQSAIVGYQTALNIKPSEIYPKTRMEEINKTIGDRNAKQQLLGKTIADADQYYTSGDYAKAMPLYKQALTQLPDDVYVKNRLDSCQAYITQLKTTEDSYKSTITAADKLNISGNLADALAKYILASTFKPNELYPQQKAEEIRQKIASSELINNNYNTAILNGDSLFKNNELSQALAYYQDALKIKPAEKYPKTRVDVINKQLSKNQLDNEKYTNIVADASKAFTSLNYTQALQLYKQADVLKPGNAEIIDKISEIQLLIANQNKTNDAYKSAITEADKQFASKKYTEAKLLYTSALDLKKDEKYPAAQIVKIDKLIGDALVSETSYTQSINKADSLMSIAAIEEAITAYKTALLIKPLEVYPANQIEKANAILSSNKKAENEYNTLITNASKLLEGKKYEQAISIYSQASGLKPDAELPKQKIQEAQKLLSDQIAIEKQYQQTINEADTAFKQGDFAQALSAYNKASELKPEQNYPKQKTAEIEKMIALDKAESQRYQDAIAVADEAFGKNDFEKSIALYTLAQHIRTEEPYPAAQIALAKEAIIARDNLNAEYKQKISEGSTLLNAAKYAEAKTKYQEAQQLKPDEKLPKDMIAEIELTLSGIEAKELKYNQLIVKADSLFAKNAYSVALDNYNQAIKIKPAEKYPLDQISKINGLLAEIEKTDNQFNSLVAEADNFFDKKQYNPAIEKYEQSLKLKPNETYPQQQISKAQSALAEAAKRKVDFERALADGNAFSEAGEYNSALTSYLTALNLDPENQIVKQKISDTKNTIAKVEDENKRYNDAIALGDKMFSDKKFREALEPYQRALTIRSAEKYPAEQIDAINKLLETARKTEDEYNAKVKKADSELAEKHLTEALKYYTEALQIKADETYPGTKIKEIETELEALRIKEEKYNLTIESAGKLHSSGKLNEAIATYNNALGLKPSETFPQEQITLINAEIKAINDKYQAAIKTGDEKLKADNLMEALNAYQQASEIKPGEQYPQLKITEINSALESRKQELEQMYKSYLTDGDQAFVAKDYYSAKSAFTKASSLKPSEEYPKTKLKEVSKLIEEYELARKTEYNKAIGEADKLFNTKIFDQAIDAYESASLIIPEDPYPAQQIARIRKYMSDHAIQDLSTQLLVISAGEEKKFSFTAIEQRLRKNNYVMLKARSTGNTAPKVYLNYGKDAQKNGGIVLRSLDKTSTNEYLIRISVQDKWYREDNNWISLLVENGSIEISRMQIAAGDE